jgi:hypothetical protein
LTPHEPKYLVIDLQRQSAHGIAPRGRLTGNNAPAASLKGYADYSSTHRRSDEDAINAAQLIRLLTRMARD